jgi:hypothetical protein
MLASMVGLALSASAAVDNSADFDIVSRTLLTGTCLPDNGAIDPGETATVRFVIKKTTDGTLSNVKVRLVPDAVNATFVSGEQTVGDMGKDATATVDFSFITTASCGGQVNLTLAMTSGANDAPVAKGTLTFDPFTTGTIVDTPHPFSNAGSIEVKDSGTPPTKAGTYPSTVSVAGVVGTVSRVAVTLNNVTHPSGSDLDVLLRGPSGQVVKLISDSSFVGISGATFTLDSAASASLPTESSTDAIVSGTYKPADYGVLPDSFPDAPSGFGGRSA